MACLFVFPKRLLMPRFSRRSIDALRTCHPDLQRVMHEAIKHIDIIILEGHRGREAQDKAYAEGFSKVRYPHGAHNSLPSRAVDIAPYPIAWNDVERFVYFAGFILGVASQLGVKLRWGGDWDGDTQVRDEKFRDYGHLELVG